MTMYTDNYLLFAHVEAEREEEEQFHADPIAHRLREDVVRWVANRAKPYKFYSPRMCPNFKDKKSFAQKLILFPVLVGESRKAAKTNS